MKQEICILPEPGVNQFQQWSQIGWMLTHHMDELLKFLAWFCEWAFSVLVIWCLRLPRFESCIQQRKTTCLLSIQKCILEPEHYQKQTTNTMSQHWVTAGSWNRLIWFCRILLIIRQHHIRYGLDAKHIPSCEAQYKNIYMIKVRLCILSLKPVIYYQYL